MIQAPEHSRLHYAARFVAAAPHGRRLARAIQSEHTAALLGDLRQHSQTSEGPCSKAHSRALVAAAAARAGAVGIDVEYHAPGRPIGAIARYLMGEQAPDDEAAYRVFTFREAYFKALGEWPDRPLLCSVAAAGSPLYRVARDLNVLHSRIGEEFMLTLVWSGAGEAVRML